MKFKKYVKESANVESRSLLLDEAFDNDWRIGRSSDIQDEIDRFYTPVNKMIEEGKFAEAKEEISKLEADLNDLEKTNSRKRFFKFPQFMIDGQRKRLEALKAKLPKNESIEDMDRRCEKCNTLLNDGGTCPKCDDGEEDYGDDTTVNEALSVREKLKQAYPELNFDKSIQESTTFEEALSNREKLKRAYPELNFDTVVTEEIQTEAMSNKEKLIQRYPGVFSFENSDMTEDYNEYDDEYDIDDDVEMDRRHAALYGGDRMYCDCGTKLSHDEYGSYCPKCEPHDPEEVYIEECDYDDNI